MLNLLLVLVLMPRHFVSLDRCSVVAVLVFFQHRLELYWRGEVGNLFSRFSRLSLGSQML